MPAQVVEREAKAGLSFGDCEITEQGLYVRGPLEYEEWEQLGEQLISFHRGIQWLLGDWLLYGEVQSSWGEKYAQAVDATRLDVQTLANYKWVARRIEKEQRRAALTWSHHMLVAGMEPADRELLLDRAAKHQWSCSEIRKAAAVLKDRGIQGQQFDPTKMGEELQFRAPPNPLEMMQQAYQSLTEKDRQKFKTWILSQ